jgi:hypothetical protein
MYRSIFCFNLKSYLSCYQCYWFTNVLLLCAYRFHGPLSDRAVWLRLFGVQWFSNCEMRRSGACADFSFNVK